MYMLVTSRKRKSLFSQAEQNQIIAASYNANGDFNYQTFLDLIEEETAKKQGEIDHGTQTKAADSERSSD